MNQDIRDLFYIFFCIYKDYPEPETVVAILKKGFKVAEIPVVMRERQGGSSSITLKKSVYYMVKVTLAILFENFRGDKHR